MRGKTRSTTPQTTMHEAPWDTGTRHSKTNRQDQEPLGYSRSQSWVQWYVPPLLNCGTSAQASQPIRYWVKHADNGDSSIPYIEVTSGHSRDYLKSVPRED
jgi:hypothetical protein